MSIAGGFISRNKKHILFVLILILSIISMNLTRDNIEGRDISSTFRTIGFSIISPFHFLVYQVSDFFTGTVNSISELKKMDEEIVSLRNTLQLYQKVSISFIELQKENENLREMLNLRKEIVYDSEVCEIIGSDPKTFFDTLYLNKGSNFGIKENMPVIAFVSGKRVLVGKISDVSPLSSKVLTLNNRDLFVGVSVGDDRIQAVVQGSNDKPGMVNLLYLPKTNLFVADGSEYLYTSGKSFFYPKGIEVGVLTSIEESQNYEVFNEGSVKLSINFSNLETVMVLKSF